MILFVDFYLYYLCYSIRNNSHEYTSFLRYLKGQCPKPLTLKEYVRLQIVEDTAIYRLFLKNVLKISYKIYK